MRFLIAAVMLAVTAGQCQAAIIVDTGTPVVVEYHRWGFDSSQYSAGEFSLGQSYVLSGVEAYFNSDMAGNVTIALHSDGGNIPGAILYSSTISVTANTAYDWHGALGLTWNVSPGTYWVSFTPDSNFAGEMPGDAPSPLGEYGQHISFPTSMWQDLGPDRFDYLKQGIRISGDRVVSHTPEPTSFALAGFAGLGMAAGAWRRRRQQQQQQQQAA